MINLHKLTIMFMCFSLHIKMHAPTTLQIPSHETHHLINNKSKYIIGPTEEPELSLNILIALILHPQAPTTAQQREELNHNGNCITIKQLREIITKQIFSKFKTSHITDATDIEIALYLCEIQTDIQTEISLLSLIYTTFLAMVIKQTNKITDGSLEGLIKILNQKAHKSRETKEYSTTELKIETEKINDEFISLIEDLLGTQPILSSLLSYAKIARMQHQQQKLIIGTTGMNYIPYEYSINKDKFINNAISAIEEEINRPLQLETLFGAALIFSFLQHIKSAESTRLTLKNYNNKFLVAVLSLISLIPLAVYMFNAFSGWSTFNETQKIVTGIVIPVWIITAISTLYRLNDLKDVFNFKLYKRFY